MESGGEITPVQNSIDDTLIAAAAAAAAIASSGSRRTQPPAPVCAPTPYCMILFFIKFSDVLHGF
jgi:hypothetical protein